MLRPVYFMLLGGILYLLGCREDKKSGSPVLTPEQCMKTMQVEAGVKVQLVAAEPLVNTPVALTFDEKGRIWVAEMQGYMPDTNATGENRPSGDIVILEDTNRDGRMDKRKVFLDSLVLPRALCLVENGLLIAEPPRLWYVTITDGDRPGKKTLVDSAYAPGGNVESQSNGLLRAMDNWIYSAGGGGGKRYRKAGEKWLIEKTMERGQWGITQDDAGRLYYNNNSQNLLGDYFTPGFSRAAGGKRHKQAGFNERIVPDNRTYPIRPNTGVNRGYMDGVLDSNRRLVKFTAACGPVIYRGRLFDSTYYNNAFVAEPAANLIKRNILSDSGYRVSGVQAYKGREFLASTDERFRPVSLYAGPDGALYIADMYRGVIQYKLFLTEYLKKEIAARQLERPLNCGRIYKVIPATATPHPVSFPDDVQGLVRLLEDPNGWVRDKAQQLLVDRQRMEAVPLLQQYLGQTGRPLTLIHALWTLEGLHALSPAMVLPLLEQPDWQIRMQALSVLPAIMNKDDYRQFIPALDRMLAKDDTLAAPYIAFLARTVHPFDSVSAGDLLRRLTRQYPGNSYVADAATVSGKDSEADAPAKPIDKTLAKGYAIFTTTCQPCHGADGNGTKSLAPPLNGSDWVTGDKRRLIATVLFGLTGPVKVSGNVYKAPEISGDMPSIGQNNTLSDADIAALLSFIRNGWENNATRVSDEEVSKVRDEFKGRQKPFTMQELEQHFAGKPNIILIVADDVGWDDLHCYGNPVIHTPNIDRLAETGLRFTHAFLTASSCSPSRCSIITGRYPHNTGAAELHTPLPENMSIFPGLLRKAGYFTAQAGKWHEGPATRRGYDTMLTGTKINGMGGETQWLQLLRHRPRDRPFFFWLAPFDAHRPWSADSFRKPHDPAGEVAVPPSLADTKATRKDLASYYNEIGRIDYYIGVLEKELERQGLAKNTILIFMSDNGRPFPGDKTRLHDSGIKTPLIVKWPAGVKRPGTTCHGLVSSIDIAPTLLELAQADGSPAMQGISFTRLLRQPEDVFRRYVFAEHNWHDYEAYERMVRSGDFLYVSNGRPMLPNTGCRDVVISPSYKALLEAREQGRLTAVQNDVFLQPRPSEEFFDCDKDPRQQHNRIHDPAYAAQIAQLKNVLHTWQQETADTQPAVLTPDWYDRVTGDPTPAAGRRGEMPGIAAGAGMVNAKGPF